MILLRVVLDSCILIVFRFKVEVFIFSCCVWYFKYWMCNIVGYLLLLSWKWLFELVIVLVFCFFKIIWVLINGLLVFFIIIFLVKVVCFSNGAISRFSVIDNIILRSFILFFFVFNMFLVSCKDWVVFYWVIE